MTQSNERTSLLSGESLISTARRSSSAPSSYDNYDDAAPTTKCRRSRRCCPFVVILVIVSIYIMAMMNSQRATAAASAAANGGNDNEQDGGGGGLCRNSGYLMYRKEYYEWGDTRWVIFDNNDDGDEQTTEGTVNDTSTIRYDAVWVKGISSSDLLLRDVVQRRHDGDGNNVDDDNDDDGVVVVALLKCNHYGDKYEIWRNETLVQTVAKAWFFGFRVAVTGGDNNTNDGDETTTLNVRMNLWDDGFTMRKGRRHPSLSSSSGTGNLVARIHKFYDGWDTYFCVDIYDNNGDVVDILSSLMAVEEMNEYRIQTGS